MMKRSILSACSFAFVASVLGILGSTQGCSSSEPSAPPDASQVASYFADAYCGALHGCCDQAKVAYDGTSCHAQMTAAFQEQADTVKRGKVIYDAKAAAACADAIKARESRCSDNDAGPAPTADAGFVDAIKAACAPVYKGTVQPGQPCEDATECVSDSPSTTVLCDRDPVKTPGSASDPNARVCIQYRAHQPLGARCHVGGSVGDTYVYLRCEPTLGYCDTSADSKQNDGTCTAFASVGASCRTGSDVCDPASSYFDFDTLVCTARAGRGERCAGAGFANECAQGLYCDHLQQTCEAALEAGATCTYDSQCASFQCKSDPLGHAPSVCADDVHGLFDISPRTCGFGPHGTGDEDAGIVPPAKAQSIRF
jgi:hypothetical protein